MMNVHLILIIIHLFKKENQNFNQILNEELVSKIISNCKLVLPLNNVVYSYCIPPLAKCISAVNSHKKVKNCFTHIQQAKWP